MVYIFIYKGWFFVPGTEMLPNEPGYHLLGISPEAFGAVGAAINFIVAYIVSGMTAPVPGHIQQLVEDVRIPKGAGVAQAH